MLSSLVSRNITVNGKRTSIRLEKHMWQALLEIAKKEKLTIHELATEIHFRTPSKMTFTATVRVFTMLYFKAAATDRGHDLAGHGKLKSKLLKIPRISGKVEKFSTLTDASYSDESQ